MRKPLIAANWKMHKTIPETREFLARFLPLVTDVRERTVAIAPPFTALAAAAEQLKNTGVLLAAQNMFSEDKGAYTGEISALMLSDIGCSFVILGHSERRQLFAETDEIVNKKIKAAQRHNLGVIFCIGETLAERESGKTYEVVKRELEKGLDGVEPHRIVIAYEPIWAIGTGKTASPEQAQEAHAFIRGILGNVYGNISHELGILYGGSVTPENIDALMACPDVDGALVGGASLNPESFARIVKFTEMS